MERHDTPEEKPLPTSVADLIARISKCNTPTESTSLTVAALSTLKSTQEKRRFLLDLTSKVEEQKKLLEKKQVAKLTARTLVSAIYAISAASKALVPTAKAAATKTNSPTVSQTSTSTAESPTVSKPATVTQTSSEEDSVMVSSSSDSTQTTSTVKETKSVSFSSEVTVTRVAPVEYPAEELNSGQDVDMRIGTQPPLSSNPSGESSAASIASVTPPNFYLENSALTKQGTPAEEASKPMNPSEMPEALKSLFSIIPSVNYSYMSNIKDKNEKDTNDPNKIETFPTSSGQSTVMQKEEKLEESLTKEKNMFNVSLLDFDYGDSDSDGEESTKTPQRKQGDVKRDSLSVSVDESNTEEKSRTESIGG